MINGHAPPGDQLNQLSGQIVDAAFAVHSALGPGLLENVYEICLAHELRKRRLPVDRQVTLPVHYDGIQIDAGFRVDLLVADQIVVEIKTVEKVVPVHHAQLLTYLKLTGHRLGLLINFNTARIQDGIKRLVN